jgi:hypothetical protein
MMEEYKRQARAALHDAMSASASYTPPGVGAEAVPSPEQIEAGLSLKVRWHNRMRISGERNADDVAILEGVNRLVFNVENLEELGLTLEARGILEIAGYSKSFRLDYQEESDGPLNIYWTVIALEDDPL